jgi:hypothetical protein
MVNWKELWPLFQYFLSISKTLMYLDMRKGGNGWGNVFELHDSLLHRALLVSITMIFKDPSLDHLLCILSTH